MRIYNTVLKISVTSAIVVVILLLTLAIVLAVTIHSTVAVLLAVSAISFTTGAVGAVGSMIWLNRIRIRNPAFLAKAEAREQESRALIEATIINESGNRGGTENGIHTGLFLEKAGLNSSGSHHSVRT
jgi:hypothetical protein